MLHHVSDKIAGPRYSRRAVDNEHYWMKSYGEFPEKVDIALLRLKDEYLGSLRKEVLQVPARSIQESVQLTAGEIKEASP
jgi:hypothetical protein